MNIQYFDSMSQISDYASNVIINEVNSNRELLLCAASGNSPTETYQKLISKKHQTTFDQLRIVKLDEWGGIPSDHSGSCETYLQKQLIKPLQIGEGKYFAFQSQPDDPQEECYRIQKILRQQGPIDLCILGLGMNGHIAFNEPAEYLQPFCHVARLSESSMKHPMAINMQKGEVYGLTLGMADILGAKKILLLISGKNKHEVIQKFLTRQVTTGLPASFLWMHPDVHCMIDKESYHSKHN